MSLDALTAYVNALFNWSAGAPTGSSFPDATFADSYQQTQAFTFGTASEQINQIFTDTRTVSLATTTDDLDLAGVLKNFHGDLIQFTNIKAIIIYNQSQQSGENLKIGGSPHSPWISPFASSTGYGDVIYPQGLWLRTAPLDGFAVSDGVADILRVRHAGVRPDITYDIIILGVG